MFYINIKLNLKKSDLSSRLITWCGRKISAEGVSFDPQYLKGLTTVPRPETGKQLQHFLRALNWIRGAIPDYANLVSSTQELLKTCQNQVC